MKRCGRFVLAAFVVGSLITDAQPVRAATAGHVVRVTKTSRWSTPSPDPSGITYVPKEHRLLISDSGVDNTRVWKGRNLFLAGLKGHLRAARSLKKATRNPVGIAWNARAKALFVADDNADAIYRSTAGPDGHIGTRDDRVRRIIYTEDFGFTDPHGVAWRPTGTVLIVLDSQTGRVYKFHRGKDGLFGTKDDVVKGFGTFRYGLTHPEGITYDSVTDHLFMVSSAQRFVVETTMTGVLVRTIDLSATGINRPSALVFARGSDGKPHHLYVTDRGVNYTTDPNENDGRLFELRLIKVP
jgi:sugar lactone lactonase YvrE